jgi:NADH:ubiquinone oxidoreductase subunit 3 (subunit A)
VDTQSKPEPHRPHEDCVSINFRYSGAWQEYNQRMMARHQIVNIYMLTASASLAFLYSHRLDTDFNFWEVALVLPAASLIVSLLFYMHDCMMADIHSFLIRCELYNNTRVGDSGIIPGYHATIDSAKKFLKNRNLQNYTIVILFIIFNIGPFYFLPGHKRWQILTKSEKWIYYFMVYTFMVFISWVFIVEGQDRRLDAVKEHFSRCQVPGFWQRLYRFTKKVLFKYGHIYVLLGIKPWEPPPTESAGSSSEHTALAPGSIEDRKTDSSSPR